MKVIVVEKPGGCPYRIMGWGQSTIDPQRPLCGIREAPDSYCDYPSLGEFPKDCPLKNLDESLAAWLDELHETKEELARFKNEKKTL